MSLHEEFDRKEAVKGSTDRGFGLVFAGFCALVGAVKTWHEGAVALPWLAAALAFLVLALAIPRVLAPLNRAWTRLGLLLFKVVSPVVLGLLYATCFVPIGALARAFGKDTLHLKREQRPSHWIVRDPPGPAGQRMRNQF